ncbi:MAG: tRNA (guanosine(37)-N1)-methyltransferase TrmD [Candidatus Levybacteria bacterium]|nr:tRNA (guanosine(37)-N1)-methyltransferase TrmD [Candidatus Levybacteria bacterium]
MKISILTLFPEMFSGPFDYSIIKRAKEKNIVNIDFVNIREFGIGRHKIVDDKPYGGGTGMILRVDVLERAILAAKENGPSGADGQKVILLGAQGKTFNQKYAESFSKLQHLILICGHYEGVDERIKNFIDEEISIGDFIVTGGEIPAMTITDAVVRLKKGVLKEGVTGSESFSPLLEYPQYTRPEVFRNMSVPKVLTSGNHKEILKWREKIALQNTKKLRPDILRSSITREKD